MSMKPIKLENKLTVNGKEVTSVTLDFSKLTGRDLIKAEAEVRADGESHLTRGAWIEIFMSFSISHPSFCRTSHKAIGFIEKIYFCR